MGEKAQKKVKEQSRKWLLTINNPVEHGFSHEEIKKKLSMIENLDYWVMCDEIGGQTKCYHTHLFIYRKKSAMKFSFMKQLFPTAHFDYPLGTSEENRSYVRKEGKWEKSEKGMTSLRDTCEEFGDCPQEQQGKRTDLNGLYNCIKDGMSDFEILEENPLFMTRLDTIGKVRELMRYEQFANCTRDLQVEYWHGKPGTGKTSGVLDRYGFQNVYIVDDSKHPWDGYKGQDVVLFDEFVSGNYEVTQLLRWLDKYPVLLPCRYNNKQACFTKVYFTSNHTFEEQFGSLYRNDEEVFNALLRRFHCFKVFDDNGNMTDYMSYNDYKSRWQTVKNTPFDKKEG